MGNMVLFPKKNIKKLTLKIAHFKVILFVDGKKKLEKGSNPRPLGWKEGF
jgi:hypothetical protein